VELHEKRHREIGVLRKSLLQVVNEATGLSEGKQKYCQGKKECRGKKPTSVEENKKVHEALHPPPKAPSDGANTAGASKKNACNHSSEDSSDTSTNGPRMTAILRGLGFNIAEPLYRSKKCKCLLDRLRQAIHVDLVSVENEDRETMMRKAGYWRYVNRRTYNAMVRNNQIWDWATGAKLEELDDSNPEVNPKELDINNHEVHLDDEDPQELVLEIEVGDGAEVHGHAV
jgi:hypothetical protein